MQLKILHHIENKLLSFRKEYLIALILITITAISYWQVKDNDFINFDDPSYITENSHVQTGFTNQSIIWAFTTTHSYNWHPVTWLSHIMDYQLYGMKPWGHHLTNLILHIINTLLIFFVFRRITNAHWQSALVSALFAIHPFHVESVAWVSERKDVLSTFFWLLTVYMYVLYTEQRNIRIYLLTLFFFILGLMSKPMVVTLPFVLLLLDYWPLGRLQFSNITLGNPDISLKKAKRKRDRNKVQKNALIKSSQKQKITKFVIPWSNLIQLFQEKIPFFVLSAMSCIMTIIAQKNAIYPIQELPFGYRMANADVSYVHYIVKMIWPINLSVFYPLPDSVPIWQSFGAATVLIFATILVIVASEKFKYLAVGWFWYLGTLVPVIGLMQVGSQAMADRYTYIPLIGIFIMIAWGIQDISRGWRNQKISLGIFTGILIIALSISTWVQVRYWRNTEVLFEHALSVNPNNWMAHYKLAKISSNKGVIDEAKQHYQKALRIAPFEPEVHKSIGLLLAAEGKISEAISHFQTALQINPHDAKAREFLEMNLGFRGNIKDAISHYRNALQLNPSDPYIHYLLGEALAKQGHFDESMSHLKEALRIKSNIAEAHNGLGIVFASTGKLPDAIFHFREALKIKPDYRDARNNLKVALSQQEKHR